MGQDRYYGETLRIGDPSNEPYEVVPDDNADLEHGQPNYLYVGVAGDVTMVFSNGETITVPLAQGYHLFRPSRIKDTGTDAEKIIVFYDGSVE